MTSLILSWLWKAFVSIASALAFYRTYLEPELKVIEKIEFLGIDVNLNSAIGREPYRGLEMEVTLNEQIVTSFMVWGGGERLHGTSQTSDGGKTYHLEIELPERHPPITSIKIAVNRWWPLYLLTRKSVALHPIISPGRQNF